MDSLISLLNLDGVPKGIALFVVFMIFFNAAAVVAWACCLIRESRGRAPPAKFKLSQS
jgi:hypothetical protein